MPHAVDHEAKAGVNALPLRIALRSAKVDVNSLNAGPPLYDQPLGRLQEAQEIVKRGL